jgi:hypothetical protein
MPLCTPMGCGWMATSRPIELPKWRYTPAHTCGGNLQVDYSGGLLVNSVNIDGNLQAFDNWGSQSYSANIIGGDLQAFDNSGGVSVLNNTIYGNLQCKENYPPPTGSGNIVHGDMEDQCAFMH